jgi:multiple sugar transport system permease protein
MGYSFWLSFQQYNILRPPVPVGFANYQQLASDPLYWKAVKNTTIYSVVSVPLQVIIGYALALLLNQKIAGLSFWRTAFYLPTVVPVVASSYLFAWVFNGQAGLINGLLAVVGIQGPNWYGSTTWALPTFILMSLWGTGGGLVIYLAAMQGVPTTLYDAAKVDGANAWQRLWHVTIPMTSPVITFMLIMGIINSFQVFTGVLLITQGGPLNSTLVYVLYLYQNGWQYLKMGYASAQA